MNAQAPTRPQVAILAGINGAGKSTTAQRLLREAMKIPLFTNADVIARGLNAFDVESEAGKAGRIMLEHMRGLVAARRSFAFETTLSGRAYVKWLKDMRADGYDVHLFYFWLESADVAIRRVADRVRAGGHHIPDDTVRRRYARSVRNFLGLYRPIVSTWQVYDNSDGPSRLLAQNNSFFDTVHDDARWVHVSGVLTMSQQTTLPAVEPLDYAAIARAVQLASRDALLEHARMGRTVSESRDGKIVDVTPAEIFARYRLDEFGRPKGE